ncbi:ead/Ea22-like family protein [Salmonella enterica]|uniref:ead/Ea22-like family protein n=1 Tax=Salmonella enterica TaxID=28901 RepID=UPI0009AC1091|nr:ead/Ea22-like family protein [Salmonella enterica]EAR6586254.1 ead/Ea22-like family protein [Salmonella enterica]EAV1936085.1 ead/Ea22-like family protein [Salmonella enterica]EBB7502265.1 ead/Ea22-like family protein [Salmonella enterica]EGP1631951.1 ead/Ea22-like family protein [Salmonella enterica]EHA5582572.1 ead/Ea22-like family protein [Salmonella enterica]
MNKQALREAAEKAGKDEWQAKKINGDFYVIRSGSYRKQCGITSYQPIAEIDHKPVRDFVALANPATMLTLLDEVEAAEHTAAVDHEAACSLVEENEELKRRVAELEIESSVKDAAIIELKQQYSRLQEARYNTPAVRDVIAERQRQISEEGWMSEHDDRYSCGELAGAAACYARYTNARGWVFPTNPTDYQSAGEPFDWPWDAEWWKPTNPRRDLVKAGALILAEIERMDRSAPTQESE